MGETLLQAVHLKKYFPTKAGMVHAVDDVTLSIEAGKTLGIVGESGCGKSTLGRTILRLQKPTGGKILFHGKDITECSEKEFDRIRPKMQIIFQDPYSSLNPRLTVQELIAEPMLINHTFPSRSEIYDRVDELMDTVGLAQRLSTAYPHELDGGRRQRIGIARALALNPEFIVCDEPVSALDVSIQAQVLNLLMDMQDQLGLTYLFITHDLSVVKHISDEIAVMYLGVCVERAPKRELFANPLHPYTKALLSAIPAPSLSARGKEFELIRGEVTSALNPPSGCRFAPRCPFCTDACKQAPLELKEHSEGHFVACIRADEL